LFERPDVRLRIGSGEREPEYAPVYRADGRFGPSPQEKVADQELSLLIAKARSEGRLIDEQTLEALRREADTRKTRAPKSAKGR
jgi:hypothetical protein